MIYDICSVVLCLVALDFFIYKKVLFWCLGSDRKCREISNREFMVWDVKLYALFACLHFFAIEKFAHFGCSIE